MPTRIKDFIFYIFVTNNMSFYFQNKIKKILLSFCLILFYTIIFNNITLANKVLIIDCIRMNTNDTKTSYSDQNQKQARMRLYNLIEAIYYAVDYKDINKFIESENTVNSLIRGVKGEINKATQKINDTSKKIERLKDKLDLHGKQYNTEPIRKEIININIILKILLDKLIENKNNILSQRNLFQQIINCLKATQEDINVKKIEKERLLEQTKDSTEKDYLTKAINDYSKAIQNVDETIQDLQLTFLPVEEFTKEILSIFKHLIGMASNFDASKEKILTLLINLSSISGKIKQPEYENTIKEHIPKIKSLNKRIEKFGDEINKYLETIEENGIYKPKFKSRLNQSTYNDLSDSIIDLLTEWKSCNEVLKEIYLLSYQIRVKDAVIKISKNYQYTDSFGMVKTILPGEYIVSRYQGETGSDPEESTVTLTSKITGDEHDISKTHYNKIIEAQ
ncbi:hypothetical protein MHK_010807 [Candidatus Magnetomorum sp. HK-1]|nr:hypothetical protein MHK_010807 [Candidatus Magnetomorum sp. HK-1]